MVKNRTLREAVEEYTRVEAKIEKLVQQQRNIGYEPSFFELSKEITELETRLFELDDEIDKLQIMQELTR